MPFNNNYNRSIAREIDYMNRNYITHLDSTGQGTINYRMQMDRGIIGAGKGSKIFCNKNDSDSDDEYVGKGGAILGFAAGSILGKEKKQAGLRSKREISTYSSLGAPLSISTAAIVEADDDAVPIDKPPPPPIEGEKTGGTKLGFKKTYFPATSEIGRKAPLTAAIRPHIGSMMRAGRKVSVRDLGDYDSDSSYESSGDEIVQKGKMILASMEVVRPVRRRGGDKPEEEAPKPAEEATQKGDKSSKIKDAINQIKDIKREVDINYRANITRDKKEGSGMDMEGEGIASALGSVARLGAKAARFAATKAGKFAAAAAKKSKALAKAAASKAKAAASKLLKKSKSTLSKGIKAAKNVKSKTIVKGIQGAVDIGRTAADMFGNKQQEQNMNSRVSREEDEELAPEEEEDEEIDEVEQAENTVKEKQAREKEAKVQAKAKQQESQKTADIEKLKQDVTEAQESSGVPETGPKWQKDKRVIESENKEVLGNVLGYSIYSKTPVDDWNEFYSDDFGDFTGASIEQIINTLKLQSMTPEDIQQLLSQSQGAIKAQESRGISSTITSAKIEPRTDVGNVNKNTSCLDSYNNVADSVATAGREVRPVRQNNSYFGGYFKNTLKSTRGVQEVMKEKAQMNASSLSGLGKSKAPKKKGRKTNKQKLIESEMKSSSMSGMAKPKKPNARAEIVRKIMKEKGMKLIEASKYVKANNLYKK